MDSANFQLGVRTNEQPRSCDLLARLGSTSMLVTIFSCDGGWLFKAEINSGAAKSELKSNIAAVMAEQCKILKLISV